MATLEMPGTLRGTENVSENEAGSKTQSAKQVDCTRSHQPEVTLQGPAEQPGREPARRAILFCLLFAAIKLAVHIGVNLQAQHLGYGLFRDELYYIVCGRRLAWGYLDNQPLIPVLTRITDALFGHNHLWTFRLLPSLAGAAKVLLTGLLARSLGGRRPAQALAMICVLAAPEYMGVDTILSMNCLEPVFWMTCLVALLELARLSAEFDHGNKLRAGWWLVFALSGGLALEAKLSGAFFLICLLMALLLTRQRKLLKDRYAAIGIALLLLIELPNFLWQLRRGFPSIQWLISVSHEGKDVVLGPAGFLWQQILVLIPFSALIWIPGLAWLLFRRRVSGDDAARFAGLTALLFIALMMALHAKVYYVVPIYPVLFAAGAVFWFRTLPRRWHALPLVYAGSFAIAVWYWLPIVLPIVPPSHYALWEHRLGFRPEETENFRQVALPQLLADMTGWPSIVEQVAAAYNQLPASVRNTQEGRLGIDCDNYGEASAIDVYGGAYGLPPAISGHQHYWYWGARGELGNTLVYVGGTRQQIQKNYARVQAIGTIRAPYAMPFENGATIWLATERILSPAEIWRNAQELY